MSETKRDFVIVWVLFPIVLGTVIWGISSIRAEDVAKGVVGVIIGALLAKIVLKL